MLFVENNWQIEIRTLREEVDFLQDYKLNPDAANGSLRLRLPVAAKIALAMVGATGGRAISPKRKT